MLVDFVSACVDAVLSVLSDFISWNVGQLIVVIVAMTTSLKAFELINELHKNLVEKPKPETKRIDTHIEAAKKAQQRAEKKQKRSRAGTRKAGVRGGRFYTKPLNRRRRSPRR